VRLFGDRLAQLALPAVLIAVVALIGSFTARTNEIHFRTALVDVAIVVGLYVFIGNSGVLSFGHISFVAVGAFSAGLMSISADVKRGITRWGTSSRCCLPPASARRSRSSPACR
jgi:branched-chain amino acid transport system permease protein